MEIAITGYQAVVGLGVIGLIVSVMIIALRYYFNQKSKNQEPLDKLPNQQWSTRTKYAAYDVFKYSGLFFRTGLICAMVASLLAFNYTQYNYVNEVPVFVPEPWIETVAPPITYPEPKPIPPPPKTPQNNEIIEAVEEIVQPKFVEVEVKVDPDVPINPNATADNNDPFVPSLPLSPPPLPKIKEVDKGPVIISEFMPRMCSSCDADDVSRKEKNACASKEMMLFVHKQLKYPSMAREVGIEGMCPVRFVVRSDGSISDIELLRDIGAGCGKEALRVTKMLQSQCWKPGIQNGRRVSVQMVLPIRFKLQ